MQEAIKIEGLSKAYGSLPALDNLSLTVRQNTVFGLLGANGAGKSTAIECILGTRQADQGRVTVLGSVPRRNRRELFQKVGVQFQESDYQPEIKVSELCEETACLYKKNCRLEKTLRAVWDWGEAARRGEKFIRRGTPAPIYCPCFNSQAAACFS